MLIINVAAEKAFSVYCCVVVSKISRFQILKKNFPEEKNPETVKLTLYHHFTQ